MKHLKYLALVLIAVCLGCDMHVAPPPPPGPIGLEPVKRLIADEELKQLKQEALETQRLLEQKDSQLNQLSPQLIPIPPPAHLWIRPIPPTHLQTKQLRKVEAAS